MEGRKGLCDKCGLIDFLNHYDDESSGLFCEPCLVKMDPDIVVVYDLVDEDEEGD